jgi:formate dehydrogenase accessory protein FdhD
MLLDGEPSNSIEDVSRHVAVDKIIGAAAFKRADPSRSIIATSGRQSSDIVMKAARFGVPILVSLRGSLYSGIYTAEWTGITLVSVTRGKGVTIYSHPERIVLPQRNDGKSHLQPAQLMDSA